MTLSSFYEFYKLRSLQVNELNHIESITTNSRSIIIDYLFDTKSPLFTTREEDEEISDKCITKIKLENVNELKEFKQLFPFFPDLELGCGMLHLNDATCGNLKNCKVSVWDKYCRINFFIPYDQPIVKIKDGNNSYEYNFLNEDNVNEMIHKFGIGKPDLDFLKYVMKIINISLHELRHPGVPFTLYYSATTKTPVSFDIPSNPKIITDKDKLVIDELGLDIIQHGSGDGSLPTASALLPALKWSLEPESRNNPIHIVDYCSNVKFTKNTIDFKNNQYLNIACRCDKPSGEGCSHSSMIGDEYLISHLSNYIIHEDFQLPFNLMINKVDLIKRGINQIETKLYCNNLKKINSKFKHYE
jgi:hypothetical protein